MEVSAPFPSLRAAFHLSQINNESVEWMTQGKYQAAFYHLQGAIRHLSGILPRTTQQQCKKERSDSLHRGNLVETHPGCFTQGCQDFYSGVTKKLLASNILNLPFTISKLSQQESEDCRDHCSIQTVASVAIFNMGMALFLQSKHAGTYCSKERLLDRAFVLYRHSLRLADEHSKIYLACCHNMVEISVHRCDLEEARKWRRLILKATDEIGKTWGTYQQAVCIYHSGSFTASRAA